MRFTLATISVVLLCLAPGCVEHNPPDDCYVTMGGVEVCDGVDNDCDGQIDEACCTMTNNGVELCDGVDNDCNGQVDDGCCTPTNGGVENCNDTLDNDCNGVVNDGCEGDCQDGEERPCGGSPEAGICTERCGGGVWGSCLPASGDHAEEVCGDGLDNDCDGDVDEMCECAPGDSRACGGSPDSNLCAEVCGDDGRWGHCGPTESNPGEEICDGLDNDCDGTIDNGNCECDAEDPPRWCGGTPELRSCQQRCVEGHWGDCEPVDGPVEHDICGDGEDNDCDGRIDEPEPCELASCGEGEARCVGTERGECENPSWHCRPGEEDTEPCDGDSTGICDPGTHTRVCRDDCTWAGWGACEGVVRPEPNETCNGLDDDCDGTVDEDAVGSDEFGDNSTQSRCYSLGTDPDRWVYPILAGADGTEDWFCFEGIDDFSILFDEHVIIDLTNIPEGDDLDLSLYRPDESGSLVELASSNAAGNADEHIDWGAATGDEDTATYYVRVTGYSLGSDGRACYSLHVNGLN